MPPKRQSEGRKPQKPNFENRSIITGDNLDVLRGMNEACVDLVYLDPPFNSNRNYAAPTGSEAAGASFKDAWTLDDVDARWLGEIAEKKPALYKVIDAAGEAHGKGMKAYLQFMSIRLLELQRVMKDTGSIYLHVDQTAAHYLKPVMDCVFGKGNFQNSVVWSYRRWSGKAPRYQRMHDDIIFYGNSANGKGHTWTSPMEPKAEGTSKYRRWNERDPATGKMVTRTDRSTVVTETNMRDVWEIGRLQASAKERCGYPTQKPIKLLERIVKASSNPGDVVLDPFAGCATACVAAEKLGRKWVGIDISDKAAELVVVRMERELDQDLLKTMDGQVPEVHHVTKFAGEANRAERIPRQKAYNHPDIKRHLFGVQEGHCACCGDSKDYADCQVDHIQPRAEGGSDNMANLQILCGPCNREKSTGLDFDAKEMSANARKERRKLLQATLDATLAKHEAAIARLDRADDATKGISARRRRDGLSRAA